MERRAFLALIASAPIAALAPWTTIVQQPDVFYDRQLGIAIRLIRQWNLAQPPARIYRPYDFSEPRWGTAQPNYPVRISG